jgi:hypothetical protein
MGAGILLVPGAAHRHAAGGGHLARTGWALSTVLVHAILIGSVTSMTSASVTSMTSALDASAAALASIPDSDRYGGGGTHTGIVCRSGIGLRMALIKLIAITAIA